MERPGALSTLLDSTAETKCKGLQPIMETFLFSHDANSTKSILKFALPKHRNIILRKGKTDERKSMPDTEA